MNFSQLECLVALADMGSFTDAAYAVGLTQSAVSHALAALETELGVTLVERNRKGMVSLSVVGQKIMPHVRALLTQAEAITQEAKAACGVAAGKLRLGSTRCLCPGLLVKLLTRFQQQYPDVEVVLFEGTMEEVEEWLDNNIIEVAFVSLPAADKDCTLIAMDELCAVMATGHRLSMQPAVAPRELSREDFIMSKTDCSYQTMKTAGIQPNKGGLAIRYQASDSATILAMVREGLGVSLMPRMMLPPKLEGIVALPLDPPQQVPIGLAIRSQETASAAAKLFVQTALIGAQVEAEAVRTA